MLNRWLIIAMFVNAFVCDESHTDSQLAAKHLARVLQTAKCDQPMPRVVYLSKHLSKYNKKYKPFATVLYVCDSGSGCCNDETQRCVAKNVETIVLHFLALEVTVEGNKKSVEAITFRNHTKCECRHINSFRLSFTADEELIPSDHIAWALYSNTINETGDRFAQLEVHTNPIHGDSAQAYHAGFIEGYLTADLMAMHWRNQIELYCDDKHKYCRKLFKFLDRNLKETQERVRAERNQSSYWHQIGLVLEQLTGLQDGYNVKLWGHSPEGPRMQVDSRGLIALTIIPELSEFELFLNKTVKTKGRDGSCSAIVKPLPDGSDLYVAHNTWVWYSMMLRVFKKYELNYRVTADSQEMIPGRISAFSSYPGALTSIDDFYILSSGLVVQETSITNINTELWKDIRPEDVVLEFIRNLVANRLAESGKEWSQIFGENNSGTYNDQFMIVDYKRFRWGTRSELSSPDLLWVLEQMPTLVVSQDVTGVLRSQGYWASYNVPFFEQIFNISGYNKLVELYGDYYSYNNTARALIFRRDQSKVRDLTTLYSLMRYNNFENDAFSRCDCVPPFTAEYAIAARNDLNQPDGTYPFDALGFRDWGAIDVKITTNDMAKRFEMLVVSSPSYERQQPFQWSTTKLSKSIRHEGHPDKWAFSPYFIKWYPYDTEIAGVTIAESPAL
ncbi:unnamed protein product [Medioppia subpectinata]|uniref:Phospholipase B-like n=1 Tax=Medioppia subpectinata TaxID=1979941 RepID=A0A7R9KGI6_9ACAR|nr:unnamed protein product [Medioppia subpectinata]CAG2102156.1 unnamed protein product [Medioppia subpectinata]